MTSFIRQCVAYFLIALLPLQAAAGSRLALCAEMKNPGHAATMAADHCAQMAAAAESGKETKTPHKPAADGCWIGSICLASLSAMAVPIMPQAAPIKLSALPSPAATGYYQSIILDSPQRPPTFL